MKSRGFTLIELMIIIVIITSITGIAINSYKKFIETKNGEEIIQKVSNALDSKIIMSASVKFKDENEVNKIEQEEKFVPSTQTGTIMCDNYSVLMANCTYTIINVGVAYRIGMECIQGIGGYDCKLTQ